MSQSTSGNSLPPGLQGPGVTFGDTRVMQNDANFRTSPSSGSAVSFGEPLNDRRSTFIDPAGAGAGEGGKQNNMSGGSNKEGGMYQALEERRTTLPSEAAMTLRTSGSYQTTYAQSARASQETTTINIPSTNNGSIPPPPTFSFARPSIAHDGGYAYLPSEAMLSGSNQLPYLPPHYNTIGHTLPSTTAPSNIIPQQPPSFTPNIYNHNNFSVDSNHGAQHGEPSAIGAQQPLQQQRAVTGVASNGLRPHQPPGIVFASLEEEAPYGRTTGNGERQTHIGGNPNPNPSAGGFSVSPHDRQFHELPRVEQHGQSGGGGSGSPLFGHAFAQGNGKSVPQGSNPLQHTFQSNVEYHTYLANNVDVRPGVSRTTIKLPRSKYTDESYFKDGVNRSTMFAPCEANVTLGCSGGLAAEEGVEKSWYNYYVYKESDSKRHFSTHMKATQAENELTPTYIDSDRARRRVEFLQKREQRAREEEQQQDALNNVSFAVQPYVTDSYTGEQMVAVQGHLAPMHCAKDLRLNGSDWDEMVENMIAGWSFDNMRVPWPFDPADRDKRIDMRAYNWFDRTNPYIKDDDAYQFMETASNYVDPIEHEKWRLRGGDNLWDQVLDVVDSIIYVE